MDLFTRLSGSNICYSGPGSVPHNTGPVSDLCAFLCPCLCSLTQHWGLAGPASLRLLCMPPAALQQCVNSFSNHLQPAGSFTVSASAICETL